MDEQSLKPATVVVKRHIACPDCGERMSTFDHLAEGSQFGPWHCKSCRCQIKGRIVGGEPHIAMVDARRWVPVLVLLRVSGAENFWLVDRRDTDVDPNDAEAWTAEIESMRYLYDEHTCPTNFLGVAHVIQDGDDDPHGAFSFEAMALEPDDYDDDWGLDDLRVLFPQLGGQTIEGAAIHPRPEWVEQMGEALSRAKGLPSL